MSFNLGIRDAINVENDSFTRQFTYPQLLRVKEIDPYLVICVNIVALTMMGDVFVYRGPSTPTAAAQALGKGSLSMYIPHVTGGNVLCWTNVRVIRSLYKA
jgi:hypothetical protein